MLYFVIKNANLLNIFLYYPIFFLVPKFLELFFTTKNTPPKPKNSKLDKVKLCSKHNIKHIILPKTIHRTRELPQIEMITMILKATVQKFSISTSSSVKALAENLLVANTCNLEYKISFNLIGLSLNHWLAYHSSSSTALELQIFTSITNLDSFLSSSMIVSQ